MSVNVFCLVHLEDALGVNSIGGWGGGIDVSWQVMVGGTDGSGQDQPGAEGEKHT